MALAYLRLEASDSNPLRLWADIGTNRFYQYRIGKEKNKQHGIEILGETLYTSPLAESEKGNDFQSGFILDIPAGLVKYPARYVQLWSFKDPSRKSPAMSKLIEIIPSIETDKVPDIFKKNYAMSFSDQISKRQECRSVSFSFQESKMSSSMFWDAILPVLKQLAPVVLPKIADYLGNKSKGEEGKENQNQQLTDIIAAVMAVLQKGNTTPTPAPPTPTTAKEKSLFFSLSRNGNGRNGNGRSGNYTSAFSSGFSYKAVQQPTGSRQMQYSKAQVFPVALIPMIASALPELIKSGPALINAVGDSGAKLMNAVDPNSLDARKEDNAFITALLAESSKGGGGLEELLKFLQSQQPAAAPTIITPVASMPVSPSLSVNASATSPLQIRFKKEETISVNGKSKYVFLGTRAIKFWLLVEAVGGKFPALPVPKSMVRLQVKDLLTGKLLLEKQYKFKDVQLNAQLELPVSVEDLQALPLHSDIGVSARFSWLNKNQELRHTEPVQCPLYLIRGAFLKGVGDAQGESIALKDPVKYRNFWHKVWEGDSHGARRWEVDLDSKYYTYYKYDLATNGRVETKIKAETSQEKDSGHRYTLSGKLKSGMEISPVVLNALLPEISANPALNPEQLLALCTDDMSRSQNQEATYRLQLRGKKDEKASVWVYPEVTIQQVTIQRPTQITEDGQVTATVEESFPFPRVSHIHFLGVKPNEGGTGTADEGKAQIDGFDTLFDAKTALMPVELEPVKTK